MPNIKTKVTTAGGSSYIVDLDYNFKLSPHIAVHEVANKEAKDDIKLILNPDIERFFVAVEDFRSVLADSKLLNAKVGLKITSGYRTPAYNAATPGASSNSDHLKLLALDVMNESFTGTMTDDKRYIIAGLWKSVCSKYGVSGYINFYDNRFHFGFSEMYGKFYIKDYR